MFITLKYLKSADKTGGESNTIVNINDIIAVDYYKSENNKEYFNNEDVEREDLAHEGILYYVNIYFRNDRVLLVVLRKSDCFRFLSYFDDED